MRAAIVMLAVLLSVPLAARPQVPRWNPSPGLML